MYNQPPSKKLKSNSEAQLDDNSTVYNDNINDCLNDLNYDQQCHLLQTPVDFQNLNNIKLVELIVDDKSEQTANPELDIQANDFYDSIGTFNNSSQFEIVASNLPTYCDAVTDESMILESDKLCSISKFASGSHFEISAPQNRTNMIENFTDIIDEQLLKSLMQNEKISVNKDFLKNIYNIQNFDVLLKSRKCIKKSKYEVSKVVNSERLQYYIECHNLRDFKVNADGTYEITKSKTKREEICMHDMLEGVENEKYVLISDYAGTGKSWMLKKCAIELNRLHPKKWLTLINLKDYIEVFKEAENFSMKLNDKNAHLAQLEEKEVNQDQSEDTEDDQRQLDYENSQTSAVECREKIERATNVQEKPRNSKHIQQGVPKDLSSNDKELEFLENAFLNEEVVEISDDSQEEVENMTLNVESEDNETEDLEFDDASNFDIECEFDEECDAESGNGNFEESVKKSLSESSDELQPSTSKSAFSSDECCHTRFNRRIANIKRN